MSRIWGFGTAAVDIRIITAEYGEGYKDKLLAQQSFWMGGGSTSNFLVQAARLGCKAGWFGKLGKDAIGDRIRCLLESENIDCSAVAVDADVVSPFNVAVYAGQARRRIGGYLLPNAMASITEKDIVRFCEAIIPGDLVLIEVGEIPVSTCIAFGNAAKAKGAQILIDVDLDPVKQCGASVEEANTLFAKADYLMPNITSLATLYPNASALDVAISMAQSYGNVVIITLGDQGAAYALPDGEVKLVSGYDITPVDTVGAGDAFHGGFAAGLAKGLPLENAVRLGNLCGAHNCLTFGAREGMITLEALTKYDFHLN